MNKQVMVQQWLISCGKKKQKNQNEIGLTKTKQHIIPTLIGKFS